VYVVDLIDWTTTAALAYACIRLPSTVFFAALADDGGLDGLELKMMLLVLVGCTALFVVYSAVIRWKLRRWVPARNVALLAALLGHTMQQAEHGKLEHSAGVANVTREAESIAGALHVFQRTHGQYPADLAEVFGARPAYRLAWSGELEGFEYRTTGSGFVLGFRSGWYVRELDEHGHWGGRD
jgi:hypothetical protein